MIRDVNHRCAQVVLRSQKVNQIYQNLICIGDGIVICIGHLLRRAVAKIGRAAGRLEPFKSLRVSQIIRWAMAANLMQHQNRIRLNASQSLYNFFNQNAVDAFAFPTKSRIISICN